MNENRKKIIIYIVLLLILLAIIFGVVVLIKNKSSQSSTTPDTADKNLFGYFTKNKNQTSSDQLSNGTTVVSNGTTVTSNSSTGFIQNVINTITGNGANQNNSNNTNGTTNSGSDTVNGGGTTTFNVGNGTSTTVSDVTVDTVTGLPTDGITVGNATNTGGGTGLGTSTTTSTTGGGVGVGTGTTGTVEDTLCRDTDTIQYRVKQPQGDVVFAEDGELIIDDRSFPAGTLAISAQGLWNGSQYIKIKECIPAEDTVDVAPFDPIVDDLSGQAPLDACRSIANTNNPTATEMRDCALYRTWSVWTYPDNYIKDPSWNEDSIQRAKFQAIKTKIRTEFNNITEKISSEHSLSNTEYDLKNLINHKKTLYQLINDCIHLKNTLIGTNGVGGLWNGIWSHTEAAKQLSERVTEYANENFKNAIKSVYINKTVTDSSLLGVPNGTFKEINFTNGNQLSTSPFAKLYELINIKAYKTADIILGPNNPNTPKDGMILPSNYQVRQPQNFSELYAQDETLSLFCKLTTVGFFYTHKAKGTSQNLDNHLFCDNSSKNHTTSFSGEVADGEVADINIKDNQLPAYVYKSPYSTDDIDHYGTDSQNNWYRVTKSYLLFKLFKVN